MSRARLRELRLIGFKSFAERTVVTFGPGISAVVGPNGSGKSNLADALRWTLGEQGRALRTRRAEDLIFAGSASRKAQGMADVSVLIDNEDRLLPVDFGEVELSRRLYRSGENEYLLNRERIRLRDLVELLDDANIADNAFLFIGQGMVDQALALRPEERRPLFEEAAGIRKHERRRRRAEADLAEAGTNLERVRDLLAELRPQARRLQTQAEQQEARAQAGADLAAALVEMARDRILTGTREARAHADALARARREADEALATLREAEEAATGLARALAERADVESGLRRELDEARRRVQESQVALARVESEDDALARERARLAEERSSALARVEEARDVLAVTLPDVDRAAEDALEEAERRLADAVRAVDELRDAGRADGERRVSARIARTRLEADVERAVRRADAASRRLEEQRRLAAAAAAAAARQEQAADDARVEALAAREAELAAEREVGTARAAAEAAEAARAVARDAEDRLRSEASGLTARRAGLAEELGAGPDERLMGAVRAMGGRPLVEGLEVEPASRIAVEAALGEALGGLLLDADGAASLGTPPAVLVLRDDRDRSRGGGERAVERLVDAVRSAGGGPLATAIRRDPDGQATRLLARCAWVPDLEAGLRLAALLPAGWRLVTRDGVVLDDLGVLRPSPRSSLLDRRAALSDVEARMRSTDAALAEATSRSTAAAAEVERTGERLREALAALEATRRARRVADGREGAAVAAATDAARERAWQAAQLERAEADDRAAREAVESRRGELAGLERGDAEASDDGIPGAGLTELEARLAAAREERDAARRRATEARGAREEALERRRRAEVGLGLAQARIEELAREDSASATRAADLAASRERFAADRAEARTLEERHERAFEASVASARDERGRLLESEARASAAREALRAAESRSRQSEVAEMESRLQLDAAREGLLVELAAIGRDGLAALLLAGGEAPPEEVPDGEALPSALEAALDAAANAWTAAGATHGDGMAMTGAQDASGLEGGQSAVSGAPSRARLAALRRRFNELGASNPYAASELAEVRERLDALEAQREDLETAIRDTRELIGRLDTLMTEQFRQTFAALEDAFGRRFEQLFGGGDAQLSLTEPDDLSTTGVEITARPPGKKRQPLAMLSGGERALTAVALLMAMLEVRPVPFCVLDEVDAALDEANIGRFSAALRSLAEDIQFVVITHNRGTIEAADALYGVTVGDDAVSRVISLRLTDLPEPVAVAVAGGVS